MIDINLIRTNPDLVKENIKKKFQDNKLELVDKIEKLTGMDFFSALPVLYDRKKKRKRKNF